MNNGSKIYWYDLVFEQLQPIHIGKLNYGVLSETEAFIPGQTMWGALTKSYNHTYKLDINHNQDLFSLTTCFYPSFDGQNILAPIYKEGKLYMGNELTEDEFRFAFENSVVSTAIMPLTQDAADESLHEIDFILHKPKIELPGKNIHKENNLKWIGLVGIEENNACAYSFFRKSKLQISVGGEVKYGFGLLKLNAIREVNDQILEKWNLDSKGGLLLTSDNPYPGKTGCILRNFMQLNPDMEIKWKGTIVPVAEFDFLNNIPRIKEAYFCISTGSSIYIEDKNNTSIGKYKLSKGRFKYNN